MFRSSPASAANRVLDDIVVEPGRNGSRIKVSFTIPMRLVTHVPSAAGDVLQMQMRVIAAGGPDASSDLPQEREVMPWKPTDAVPLREVSFEADGPAGPQLVLRFTHRVSFTVRGAADLRSVIVTLPPAAAKAVEPAVTKGRTKVTMDLPPVPDERLSSLMAEAAKAMTGGDYRRAVRLYTKVTQYPENRYTREARELLGLARERKGQLAHAVAEYEEYLRRYPEGEGADRVRQRLAGLLTATAKPRQKLRKAKSGQAADSDVQWDGFGSVSQFYRRDESFRKLDGRITNQSALISDIDLNGRARSQSYETQARLTASHTLDFLDSGGNDTRLITLYVDEQARSLGLSGRFGRQSRNSGGILGRFDGGLVSYRVIPEVRLNAVGGFPVESSTMDGINTDRYFFGVSADLGPFAEFWEFSVYAINQIADGFADRRAVGAEARYSRPDFSAFTLVDYDILFNVLNSALAVGTYTFTNKATLNVSLTHQKSPVLTTSNALQGQTARTLSSLNNQFSESQLRDLARDRTATTDSLTVGASHPLNTKFQVSGDVTVSTLSDTETSGGVQGTPGTGAEFFYSAQLLGSNLIKEGDITILGLRYSDTSTANTVSFTVNTRYPGTPNLRINPRLRVDYQDRKAGNGSRFTVRPSVRLNYRWKRSLNLELEGGGEWSTDKTAGTDERTIGYFVDAGFRFDF